MSARFAMSRAQPISFIDWPRERHGDPMCIAGPASACSAVARALKRVDAGQHLRAPLISPLVSCRAPKSARHKRSAERTPVTYCFKVPPALQTVTSTSSASC